MNALSNQKEATPTIYRGYESLNRVCVDVSFVALLRAKLIDRLAEGGSVNPNDVKVPQFSRAALNMLASQNVLELDRGERFITPDVDVSRFSRLFHDSGNLVKSVKHYGRIKKMLKRSLGVNDESEVGVGRRVGVLGNERGLVPAAATYLHEATFVNPNEPSPASLLAKKHSVNIGMIDQKAHLNDQITLLEALSREELVALTDDHITARPSGLPLFKLGGYAELLLSYYDMFEKMTELMRGELEYGLGKDINRDAELNARASNGILNVKVAPYITQSLWDNADLRESLGSYGVYLDYGSGGGDMVMQVSEEGPRKVKKLIGIDINPAAVAEAQRLVEEEGYEDIDFVTGSITDPETLLKARRKVENGAKAGFVASINFILHDIGPKLSLDFLRTHAEVFRDAPLVITETLRMPMDVLRAHPNYQAASFQFMHEASGQHLYSEQELRNLLVQAGYEIITEKAHSSMPNADYSGRLNTIVTWVTRFKG